jgi:hypothetical protein
MKIERLDVAAFRSLLERPINRRFLLARASSEFFQWRETMRVFGVVFSAREIKESKPAPMADTVQLREA